MFIVGCVYKRLVVHFFQGSHIVMTEEQLFLSDVRIDVSCRVVSVFADDAVTEISLPLEVGIPGQEKSW